MTKKWEDTKPVVTIASLVDGLKSFVGCWSTEARFYNAEGEMQITSMTLGLGGLSIVLSNKEN